MPASKETKNADRDLKARYTTTLIVSVDTIWPESLMAHLFFSNYLFFLAGAGGAGSGLRYLLNTAQVLGPTLPSASRPFVL